MSAMPDNQAQSVFARYEGKVVLVQPVVVTDVQMPFGSMVGFMVKWAIAAIPALLILLVIFSVVGMVAGGFFGALMRG